MVEEFITKEVESKIIDILYFDWTYIDKNGNEQANNDVLGPKSFTARVHLKEYVTGTDLKKEAAEFLEQNVFEIEEFPKLYSLNNYIDSEFKLKLKQRILNSSQYIALNGRIGQATDIVANTKTVELYNIMKFDKMNVIINEFIPDNTFYIIRNTEMNEPGFKFVYYTSTEGITYYSFMSVGFFPQHQAVKFVIYNTNGPDDSNLMIGHENYPSYPGPSGIVPNDNGQLKE